jgi:DNA (cytosine-5)-methyltransferase 1
VGYVEREAFSAANLVARMADEGLGEAPVWSDVVTFDARPYRGRVDILTAGLPCQPYSVAGSQLGNDDERALWPHFIRIVEECEPAVVFLENVPGFLKHFEPVWRELRRLGFDVAAPMLHTASELGAPHARRRLFVLAAHPERMHVRVEPRRRGGSGGPGAGEPRHNGAWDADADRERLEGKQPARAAAGAGERGRREHGQPADADGGGREGEWSGWVLDRERETLRHDADRCGSGCRTCGTAWATESPVLRMADGPAHRVDRLRAIGNGVVPAVVAEAYRELYESLI